MSVRARNEKFGTDRQITIPASGLGSAARKGLTEHRIRQLGSKLLASLAAITEAAFTPEDFGLDDKWSGLVA